MDPPPAPKADPQPFPTLQHLDPAAPHEFATPTKRINEGTDVDRFLTSRAYRDIGVFIMQLNRAVCPRRVPGPRREMARTWGLDTLSERELPASVRGVREVLRRAGEVVGEVPPDKGPRRFGNVSFRRWFDVVEERVDGWLGELIPEEVLNFGGTKAEGGEGEGEGEKGNGAKDELKAYLLGSFGSKQRMDYGTGHELSFLAFLGCLWKLGAFRDGKPGGEIERQIVLGVFEPYLKVIRRLILTYTLEPAGSHGVWGLDDHSFLPYVFGSAQLTRPITDEEPMPLEGSVRGAPKAGDVIKGDVVREERERNMYFSAIGFINDVKSGPFWEHSPILFDISGVQDGWGKINKGMIKMYNAEVLSKFPVVQHFPFGSLFSFDHDPDASAPSPSVHTASLPTAAPTGMQAPTARPGAGTAAPFAAAGTGTGVPGPTARPGAGTAAPWAQGAPRAGTGAGVGTGTGIPAPTARPGVGTAAPWAQGGQAPGIPYSRVPGRGRGDGR